VIRVNRDDSGDTAPAPASGVSDDGEGLAFALAGGGRSPYECRKAANFAVVAAFTCCALTWAVILAAVADCRASWNLLWNDDDDAAAAATVVDLLDVPSVSTGEGAGAGVDASSGGERLGAGRGAGTGTGAGAEVDVVSIVVTVRILPLLLVSSSSSGSFVSSCIP